jgi:hypothetical protein
VVSALLDTNLLIDFLQGEPRALAEIQRYQQPAISEITWMEVMVGTNTQTEEGTRAFLNSFRRIAIDKAVAEQAVKLRKQYRLKLPDAIVWASAQTHSLLFVTRDSKDFPVMEPGIRVPW